VPTKTPQPDDLGHPGWEFGRPGTAVLFGMGGFLLIYDKTGAMDRCCFSCCHSNRVRYRVGGSWSDYCYSVIIIGLIIMLDNPALDPDGSFVCVSCPAPILLWPDHRRIARHSRPPAVSTKRGGPRAIQPPAVAGPSLFLMEQIGSKNRHEGCHALRRSGAFSS